MDNLHFVLPVLDLIILDLVSSEAFLPKFQGFLPFNDSLILFFCSSVFFLGFFFHDSFNFFLVSFVCLYPIELYAFFKILNEFSILS
jgi:hypothetical protein